MRSLKKDPRKVGIFIAWVMLLLVLTIWMSASAVHAQQVIPGSDAHEAVTAQATPTTDTTVAALQKEQLTQQIAQQRHTWSNWLWGNAATILSTLVIVVGALFGWWRWRRDRQDAHDKELKDRQSEREKRAEERFQTVVEGFGSEREEARVGAAIMLRTFLRPGYEQFYNQAFDLAVAHLRPRKADPNTPYEPSDSLRLALIFVLKESFPLARDRLTNLISEFEPKLLDATEIQLDNAYLSQTDLRKIRMRSASLQGTYFWKAHLDEAYLKHSHLDSAFLREAHLEKADLGDTDLARADLTRAYLQGASLTGARLEGTDLQNADLTNADLRWTHPENARSLKDTNLRGVKGLTREQLTICKAKGAIIDEDPTTSVSQSTVVPSVPPQSNDVQASSASYVQESNTNT